MSQERDRQAHGATGFLYDARSVADDSGLSSKSGPLFRGFMSGEDSPPESHLVASMGKTAGWAGGLIPDTGLRWYLAIGAELRRLPYFRDPFGAISTEAKADPIDIL